MTNLNRDPEAIAAEIAAWDLQDVRRLRELLDELEACCDDFGRPINTDPYVDFSDLPSAPIPDDIDTGYPVWAMDVQGYALVGDDARDIEHIDEIRAHYQSDSDECDGPIADQPVTPSLADDDERRTDMIDITAIVHTWQEEAENPFFVWRVAPRGLDWIDHGARIRVGEDVRIAPGVRIPDRADIGDNVRIEHGVTLGEGVRIADDAVIGRGSKIGARAFIGARTVIGANSTIGHQAIVERDCLIGEETQIKGAVSIGAGTSVGYKCVVRSGADVGPYCQIDRECRIGQRAYVGPYCKLGKFVSIGDHSAVRGWAILHEHISIKNRVNVPASALLGEDTRIGNRVQFGHRVRLGAGCHIGDDAVEPIDLGYIENRRWVLASVDGVAYVGVGKDWLPLADAIERYRNDDRRRLSAAVLVGAEAIARELGWRLESATQQETAA
jgi:acyl-[acyl carrier protein]--UDP-N-acetylglucosamine O-acyltransferase